MLRVIGGVLRRIATVLGALLLLQLVVLGALWVVHRSYVPRGTVLELDLDGKLAEWVPDDPLAALVAGRRERLRDVLDALERGRDDDRVAGLVVRIGDLQMGLGELQEVRDAVRAFARSGKPTLAFAETFGEFGPGNGAYYLATGFPEIWLQPSGDLGLTGILLETPFLRGTLDKLGVEPRMDHRKAYKTAMNLFTERAYTPAHRESAISMMDSMFGQIVRGIAEARGVDEARVRALIDGGPLSAQEALDAHLVDRLGYRDEAWAHVADKAGADAPRWTLDRYLAAAGRPHDRGARIALVHAVGGVHRGRSSVDPTSGDVSMGSDTVAKALRAAVADEAVRAIVLRIDSPGGSYVASDVIWREVGRARANGKPVVASMGDLAASGGYFVALDADRIVAQPGTLTASIGVLGGKMLANGLFDKLGVTFDEVHSSANATMWSWLHDYDDAERARFEGSLDRIYADFTGKVAAGRKLTPEQVEAVAQGRVWTGEQALRLGLVDELGGYPEALAAARKLAGLMPDAPIELTSFPPRRSFAQAVIARLTGGEDGEDEPPTVSIALGEALRPVAAVLRAIGVVGEGGVLRAPVGDAAVR